MSKAQQISERFWNLPQKAGEETLREQTFIDDIIQKAHIEREILSDLEGVKTAFDGGAGYGRFSILLAKKGIHVTHFDISRGMIAKAKELAEREGVLENITFVEGALEDLSAYPDRQFDLVMSFDAPISYTYPNHERVIRDLARMAKKRIVLGVYCRLAWTYGFDIAQKRKYIIDESANDPFVRWTMDHCVPRLNDFRPNMADIRAFYETGLMEPVEATAEAYDRGETPWPVSYAFMPEELLGILESAGAKDIKLAGPGALSRSIPGEVLKNIVTDSALRADFLDFAYWYDSQPSVAGMGKDNIVASARLR